MEHRSRRYARRALGACLCAASLGSANAATADAAPAAYEDAGARFQLTYVWQRKPGFAARYSGENSLRSEREPRSYSFTSTAFLGTRIWDGGELYFNPEIAASQSLSDLHGLGGLTNGENEKGGGPNPLLYRARLFVRQTWGLGGGSEAVESAPNQLAGTVDRNRVVLTAGNFSVTDVFDANAYSHDPRTQFLNWSIMTHGTFDYPADTRGYSFGAAFEYYRGDWALRLGRFAQPIESNGLALDDRIFSHYGDQLEIERGHAIAGLPGKVRLLLFRNRANMGGFADAVAAWRAGGSVAVPTVAAVRRDQDKKGLGVNLEQSLSADIGAFFRASRNDGKTETYAFTEIERSASAGVSIRGAAWRRPDDRLGFAWAQNGLAADHRDYLAHGGLGAFIGDGAPPPGATYRYAPERIFEGYYSIAVTKSASFSLDYQRAAHPAYNADRGPARFVGARLHWEL